MATKWDRDGKGYTGPTLEDCQKLWDTLVTEYVTDLAVRVEFQTVKEPHFRSRLVCWSPGLDPETGGPKDHIWGIKDLQAGFEMISYRQLFDLLIVSHRKIEGVIGGQQALPLP